MNQTAVQKKFHALAGSSLFFLIVLCISWEMFLAPLRPGGSWMVLKVLPLLLLIRGIWIKDNYTMQWSSLLIWLYFTEGIVRANSDQLKLSANLGWLETILSITYFLGIILYLRPLKKAANALKKSSNE
ncbi:MAG: DUF2069 domain-containing protein [Burkholderiales bacterium]|nr:DUF2069 domain-containing protein [Burkholderiales bacterium]